MEKNEKQKDQFSNFKKNIEEIKAELEEQKNEERSEEELKKQTAKELEEEIFDEKQDLKILGTIVVFVLFVFIVVLGIFYLALHKHFDKVLNKIIETIPVTEVENKNEEPTSTPEDEISKQTETPKSNTINCTKPFDATYTNKKEQIILMFDGSYDKVENDNYVATGTYTIKNSTITVIVNPENDITKEITIEYNISKDCKTLTDKSSNQKYTKE